MQKRLLGLLSLVGLLWISPTYALLLAGPDIINAPAALYDDPPGAVNDHQQAFNERRDVLLPHDLQVDNGIIAAGARVDSHMIFLNTMGNVFAADLLAQWAFDGTILGVMSDSNGILESASNTLLGAADTLYNSAFAARGLEGDDSYVINGGTLSVSMHVSEPGDWIRVVTQAVVVPEPAALSLFALVLVVFGLRRYLLMPLENAIFKGHQRGRVKRLPLWKPPKSMAGSYLCMIMHK